MTVRDNQPAFAGGARGTVPTQNAAPFEGEVRAADDDSVGRSSVRAVVLI